MTINIQKIAAEIARYTRRERAAAIRESLGLQNTEWSALAAQISAEADRILNLRIERANRKAVCDVLLKRRQNRLWIKKVFYSSPEARTQRELQLARERERIAEERREAEIAARIPANRRVACAALRRRGYRLESRSSSGSLYYYRDNDDGSRHVVRVADHDVPLTAERADANARSWAGAEYIDLRMTREQVLALVRKLTSVD